MVMGNNETVTKGVPINDTAISLKPGKCNAIDIATVQTNTKTTVITAF